MDQFRLGETVFDCSKSYALSSLECLTGCNYAIGDTF